MRKEQQQRRTRLRTLKSGDPKTAFHTCSASEILALYGLPKGLLSTSKKSEKCGKVGVLNRVLYLTPGVFCPAATPGCLKGCLGHTSGLMQLPSSTIARDRRTALYLESNDLFMQMLRVEIEHLRENARRLKLTPAVRLNGTSDIPWEILHPRVFDQFPDVQFFDYTKLHKRVRQFLSGSLGSRKWPANYHLTYSADGSDRETSREVLSAGGNVATVFHPVIPTKWWNTCVIDGDEHDARFLDQKGVIVGLRAKGIAKVDTSGFVVRPCPVCEVDAPEMEIEARDSGTHRTLRQYCRRCATFHEARWMLPQATQQIAKAA